MKLTELQTLLEAAEQSELNELCVPTHVLQKLVYDVYRAQELKRMAEAKCEIVRTWWLEGKP